MWIGYYVIILLIGLFLPFLNMPIFNFEGHVIMWECQTKTDVSLSQTVTEIISRLSVEIQEAVSN